MSQFAYWFEDMDAERLVAVVAPNEELKSGDEVLAYALAWQGDRDLLLVLPRSMVEQANIRRAWLETPIRLWCYGDDTVARPVPELSRSEAKQVMVELPMRSIKQYAISEEHRGWMNGISTSGLEEQARTQYVSWHHGGLQVLRVSRKTGGLEIRAGVQYKTPPPDRKPLNLILDCALTFEQALEVNRVVEQVLGDGGSLTSSMLEHRLQAKLPQEMEKLGLVAMHREFPAYRGPGRRGFIDFLGHDERRLRVVETKVGYDPGVVLQALDYAIWVEANQDRIWRLQEWKSPVSRRPVGIDFVLSPKDKTPAVNKYMAGQLEALSADIDWRIFIVDDAGAEKLIVNSVSRKQVWTPIRGRVEKAVHGPRWPKRVETELLHPDGIGTE